MTGNAVAMRRWGLQALLALLLIVARADGENLTPPYFNLAEGKEIIASATCGVNSTGPELYCKLVGANSDQNEDINLIQGQVCDYCDPSNPEKNHPPEHAVDGMETWWQSPPLSRSMKYNYVNLTINLEQEFHVAYVYVRMGNSPRPGLWALEKSKDYGKTWSPWQFFSDSESDCLTYFGVDAHTPITRDDSVICTTEYSKIVPLEGGEIPISILNNRPSAKHYFNSTLLQEWTRATNVRFRFLRTKNLLGHLMSVARQDPTVTRRYFYSIKDISIGGRCMCNGHADTCDIQDPAQPKKLVCRCQHNTHGPQCASCLPGFQQKKWQQSTTFKKFTCEPCNCFGHSNECEYDPKIDEERRSLDIHGNYDGGGVCQNCSHNTEGTNCNRCKSRFYRPRGKPLNATDVCQPCNCDLSYSTGNCADSTGQCECRPEFTPPNCNSCSYGYFGYPNCRPCECKFAGTEGYHCEAIDGQCPCKPNYAGHYCDLCAERYYKFPDCLPCNCNRIGALNDVCDVESGNCTCKNNFGGRSCDICEDGYFNYPTCEYCKCDSRGTEPSVCDKTNGACLCKEGYGGSRCDQCVSGYYGYPNCRPCNCSKVGSSSVSCDSTGKCSCLDNFAGRTCDQCSPGYYKYPDCVACECDSHGSIGVSCDAEGECQCHENFDGLRCSACKEGFYNFPRCEGCNCDPAGVVESFKGCGSLPAGELCQCKDRVQGRICNQCKPLYWNLLPSNADGCENCQCDPSGTIGGIGECDPKNGQCICKPGATGRSCSHCVDGTFNLRESNLFGCEDCGCDIGGSIGNFCDKKTGQCACQPRVTGLTCKEPLQMHYFPTLHQFRYEAEDGRTPAGKPVRYGYEEQYFPGYSWKGYAGFDSLQDEIIQHVDIHQPSVYRMVLRFVNRNAEPVVGRIVVTPDSPSELEQEFKVVFRPSVEPAFVTVAGDKTHGIHGAGGLPSPFVMNPGRWSVSVKTEKSLFLDYFVLLPSEYYEATLLTQDVNLPCEVGQRGLCRHYGYPSLARFDAVRGYGGFIDDGEVRLPLVEYFSDAAALAEVGETEIPLINGEQRIIQFELTVSKPGPHVLVVTYLTDKSVMDSTTLLTEAVDTKGRVILYPCRYTSVCRQVVTDPYGKIAVLRLDTSHVDLRLVGEADSNVAIHSIVAVPYDEWSLDYIEPKSVCVRKDGRCVQGMFPGAADAKKVEFEQDNPVIDVDVERPAGIYDNGTKLVHLRRDHATVDVTTRVPQPGDYILIVQYYQPDHPGFELGANVANGRGYEARLLVDHCPSNSGCRGIVRQPDGQDRFQLDDDVVLSFNLAGEHTDVWLDYLLIIPAEQYSEKFLKKIQFDQTKEFIKRCGHNNFHSNVTEQGFCRDSVFSLTTHYNSGALPCLCLAAGAKSFECEKFGGQCPCRENIIGRRCEICRMGFYGYPNCKPCNCPSAAFCEPETGECICPPRVIGERCDECEAGTYGFHPIVGCEECECSPVGVLNGDLQCDLLDGTCRCKRNVVGRKCDKCQAGYSQFPHCARCDCDFRGTTAEICDQYTAECHCKANVQGSACDVCRDGTFNIQADNEQGCSKCFCFGKTTRCASASLYRTHTTNMRDWEVVLLDEKSPDNVTVLWTIDSPAAEPRSVVVPLSDPETFEKMVYLSAPEDYLGKKLTSYGGTMNYTIHYSIGPFGKAVQGADVILHGAGSFLLYYCDEQPPSFTNFRASLRLVESNLLTTTNLPVTREQLLTVLEDLRGIYVRATYWNSSIEATLTDVTLDEATENYSHSRVLASSVEQCQCPPNYQGLSCEECAPGYYRVESGRSGGSCVKCQCNGHAETCDVHTGVCHDCKDGTTGDHCELCEQGYYGNATFGTPTDCLICACPLPMTSNNFATGCEMNAEGDKISCDCKRGYWGARCESCAAGFFGRPEVEGEFCRPCECSGNIDTNEIDSCDSVTGECRHCLNNTYGEACNYCAPGFFGDAIERKDCQSCYCDSCGMETCDSSNGVCQCKRNVVGEKCDRCEINHYGFQRCQGCDFCDCGEAAESSQCDDETGQCRCKPGVTGRRCDRCIAGFWNYGPDGCASCGCNTGYSLGASCNTTTGQCSCLPGVIGEKCDHCPYRWVLKEGDGCYECDSCIHDLLDVTDELANSLTPVAREFNSTAESYFTHQRLKFIVDTVNDLEPDVRLLDPTRIDFLPLQTRIEALDDEIARQKRLVVYTAEDSVKWRDGARKTLDDMNDLENDVAQEIDLVKAIIGEVRALAFSIESGTGSRVDSALREAEATLQQIKEMSFTTFRDAATDQLDQANIIVSEMMEYNLPVAALGQAADGLGENVREFGGKVDDLFVLADLAGAIARDAERLVEENQRAVETGNFDVVKNFTAEARDDIAAGQRLNEEAFDHLHQAALRIDELRRSELEATAAKLRERKNANDDELLRLTNVTGDALNHAENLHHQSVVLDDVLADTRNTSAVRAVSAYREVDETIGAAREDAVEALQAANNATSVSRGIGQRTREAREKSTDLLRTAREARAETEGKLSEDLRSAIADVDIVNRGNKKSEEALAYIDRILKSLEAPPESTLIDESTAEARKIDALIDAAVSNMRGLVDEIPRDVEETKRLSKETTDSMRDVSQANKQLDSVERVVPNVTELLDRLNSTQRTIGATGKDLMDKIERLKSKVANAREMADKFYQTGLTFYRNTTLQLKNPENLPLLATSTKLSVYLSTNKTNGFVLYLGNENTNAPRAKTHDFMALMIESGYPVLIVDLGSGPEKVISKQFVSDNVWRQIVVDRTGKNVKLIVREEVGESKEREHVTEHALPGTFAIFNLDREQSKLFVGGYPSSFQIQDAVTSSSFEGEMQDLVVGDRPVSFWNFLHGENNRVISKERDKLVDFATTTGYRFDSNGYVVLSLKNAKIRWEADKFWITLKFKTFAEEGLIYLTNRGRQFMSLEMQNGRVVFRFDLGQGEALLRSEERFNDGEEHTLEARRLHKIGVLKIDKALVAKAEGPGESDTYRAVDPFYIGGYPLDDHHLPTVTNVRFDGCIDNVVILETPIDMSKNVHALGVTPGCPVRFASLVSFEEGAPGYVRWTNVTAEKTLQINLKFKTQATNGLIFYATDPEQMVNSLLSLVDGRLVFRSQGEEVATSSAGIKFNDNEWHVVTATHNDQALRLDIDDTENYDSDFSPPMLSIAAGSLYVGGMPNALGGAAQGGSEATMPFVGCIGDTTLNGGIINFASTKERPNAFLGKCLGVDQSPGVPAVVKPIPGNWPPPLVTDEFDTTAAPPESVTRGYVVIDTDEDEEENTIGGNIPIEGRPKPQPQPPAITEAPTTVEIDEPHEETTTIPPPPRTVDQCQLPYFPAADPNTENAWRFGAVRNSRFEYRSIEGRYKDDYDFQIDVQTIARDGVVFYTADLSKRDLIAVYLQDGRVNYKFDCGSGPAVLTSLREIDDNQWHTIVFKRKGNLGELIVGDDPPVTGYSQGHTKSISVNPPFYVGGVPHEIAESVFSDIGVNKSLQGCVANFMTNGQHVGEPAKQLGVIPCSKHVEPGLFFHPGNGTNLYKAIDRFTVGRSVDIELEIKPRSNSGHLLSIHGRRDYLLLEMVNGTIRFLVKASKGPFETSFVPTAPNSLCDGNWHNIRVMRKKNALQLFVGHAAAPPAIGAQNSVGVLTKHPVYVGGHPLLAKKLRGSTSHAQYVGCMRNLRINRSPQVWDPQRAYGRVLTGVCPTI